MDDKFYEITPKGRFVMELFDFLLPWLLDSANAWDRANEIADKLWQEDPTIGIP